MVLSGHFIQHDHNHTFCRCGPGANSKLLFDHRLCEGTYVCLRLFTLVKGREGKAGKGTYVCLRSLREGRKRDVRLFTFVKGREGKAGKGTYVC